MSGAPGPERLWFLGTLVTVRVSAAEGDDAISVLEHRAPCGDAAPLHVHRTEDEVFHLLEGELLFVLDGAERRLGAGEIALAPKGVPHTYRVLSPAGARWLTVTARRDFERFVRALSVPAATDALPPPELEVDEEALGAAAARHGIDIVGPPPGEPA